MRLKLNFHPVDLTSSMSLISAKRQRIYVTMRNEVSALREAYQHMPHCHLCGQEIEMILYVRQELDTKRCYSFTRKMPSDVLIDIADMV